jgi:hypothetical protein
LRRLTGVELVEHGHQHNADYQPNRHVFHEIIQAIASLSLLFINSLH